MKTQINLSGPDGNAYALMGYASRFGKQLEKSKDEIAAILTDMQSSDYDHLLDVFRNHFGDFVDLVE